MFYAVTPLPWCPHLVAVCPIPEAGLDVTQPCQDCGALQENWVCLSCYEVCNRGRGWGRNWPRNKLQVSADLCPDTHSPISGLLWSLHQCPYAAALQRLRTPNGPQLCRPFYLVLPMSGLCPPPGRPQADPLMCSYSLTQNGSPSAYGIVQKTGWLRARVGAASWLR